MSLENQYVNQNETLTRKSDTKHYLHPAFPTEEAEHFYYSFENTFEPKQMSTSTQKLITQREWTSDVQTETSFNSEEVLVGTDTEFNGTQDDFSENNIMIEFNRKKQNLDSVRRDSKCMALVNKHGNNLKKNVIKKRKYKRPKRVNRSKHNEAIVQRNSKCMTLANKHYENNLKENTCTKREYKRPESVIKDTSLETGSLKTSSSFVSFYPLWNMKIIDKTMLTIFRTGKELKTMTYPGDELTIEPETTQLDLGHYLVESENDCFKFKTVKKTKLILKFQSGKESKLVLDEGDLFELRTFTEILQNTKNNFSKNISDVLDSKKPESIKTTDTTIEEPLIKGNSRIHDKNVVVEFKEPRAIKLYCFSCFRLNEKTITKKIGKSKHILGCRCGMAHLIVYNKNNKLQKISRHITTEYENHKIRLTMVASWSK